jgi:hypothetical protein
MRLGNKIKSILKSKSGVSLMFVMGTMMLLLAIGASVMAAASANVGANVRQNQYNRATLLGNSIHRNIMYSLQADWDGNGNFENSLAYQLANAFYEAGRETDALDDGLVIELNLALDDVPVGGKYSVTLEIQPHEFDITFAGPVGYIPETSTNRIPRTASIHAIVTVTVVVEVETGLVVRDDDRVITTRATYNFTGLMSDEELSDMETEQDSTIFDDEDLVLVEAGFGWELINLEITESSAGS